MWPVVVFSEKYLMTFFYSADQNYLKTIKNYGQHNVCWQEYFISDKIRSFLKKNMIKFSSTQTFPWICQDWKYSTFSRNVFIPVRWRSVISAFKREYNIWESHTSQIPRKNTIRKATNLHHPNIWIQQNSPICLKFWSRYKKLLKVKTSYCSHVEV